MHFPQVVCEARGLGWGALKKAPLQFYGEDEEDVRWVQVAGPQEARNNTWAGSKR